MTIEQTLIPDGVVSIIVSKVSGQVNVGKMGQFSIKSCTFCSGSRAVVNLQENKNKITKKIMSIYIVKLSCALKRQVGLLLGRPIVTTRYCDGSILNLIISNLSKINHYSDTTLCPIIFNFTVEAT